jgi:hypothetical protein
MNYLKITIIVMLFSSFFVACQKEKELAPEVPAAQPTVPNAKPVQGLWSGKYYGLDKSIPVYFSLLVKADGKLDILNPAQHVIGSGTWQLNEPVFKTSLKFLSIGETYSFVGELSDSPRKLNGTWGRGASETDGGLWNMDKIN